MFWQSSLQCEGRQLPVLAACRHLENFWVEQPLSSSAPWFSTARNRSHAVPKVNVAPRFANFEHPAAQGLFGINRREAYWKESLNELRLLCSDSDAVGPLEEWTPQEVDQLEQNPEDGHQAVSMEHKTFSTSILAFCPWSW